MRNGPTPEPGQPTLVRAIGRWSLAALMVNIIIGSGIYGLPASVAAKTGQKSPLSFLLAGAGIAVIAACFAEVASRFRGSGGPYLYTKVAFGRLAGLQVGWLNWLSRLAASAASASLFPSYLAQLWPRVQEGPLRILTITFLIAVLAAINIRGVKMGTQVSNLLTASKLGVLFVFVAGGCLFLMAHRSPVPLRAETYDAGTWLNSVLLVIFAYTGFEAALIPAGETANPGHDAPIALLTALGVCTPLYVLVQFVVVRILSNPSQNERPLAAAATLFGGPGLASMIVFGVLLSVVGYLAAGMIVSPRITFALSEQGDFPRWFAVIHPRFRTPYVSILVYAVVVSALGSAHTFSWNAKLSATSRLVTYALSCAALPMLRWKRPGEARFRLPLGRLFSLLGVAFCVALLTQAGKVEAVILVVVATVGLLNWVAVRLTSPNTGTKAQVKAT